MGGFASGAGQVCCGLGAVSLLLFAAACAAKQHPIRRDRAAAESRLEATVDDKGKAQPERLALEDDPPSGGSAGLSRSGLPKWLLIADADVSSLDVTQPSASIGFERSGPKTLLRMRLRKNLGGGEITGDVDDPALGKVILQPALAAFSSSAHAEWYPFVWIQCSEDCNRTASETNFVHTKWGFGLYLSAEAADAVVKHSMESDAPASDSGGPSKHVVPVGASLGGALRVEGLLPADVPFGNRAIVVSPYAGLSMRQISGDVTGTDIATIFGSNVRGFYGFEAGFYFQLGNVAFDSQFTYFRNDNEKVPGLTGAQLTLTLSFILPWTVVGAKSTNASDAADAGVGDNARKPDGSVSDGGLPDAGVLLADGAIG